MLVNGRLCYWLIEARTVQLAQTFGRNEQLRNELAIEFFSLLVNNCRPCSKVSASLAHSRAALTKSD